MRTPDWSRPSFPSARKQRLLARAVGPVVWISADTVRDAAQETVPQLWGSVVPPLQDPKSGPSPSNPLWKTPESCVPPSHNPSGSQTGARFLSCVVSTPAVCGRSPAGILLTVSTTGTAAVCPFGTLTVLRVVSQRDG